MKQLIYILVLFQVLHLNYGLSSADEITPERMIDEKIFDDALLTYSFMDCLHPCFYSSKLMGIISCDVPPANLSDLDKIPCSSSSNGVIVIGGKRGIRHLEKDSLGELIKEIDSFSPQPSLITINFKLNFMNILASNFKQLSKYNLNLKFSNIFEMHPDSIIEARMLNSFEIDSRKTPKLLLDISDAKERNINVNNQTETKNFPAFLRLQPMDTSSPIGFNLPVCCHSCQKSVADQSLIIVTFGCSDSGENLRDKPKTELFFIFPNSCPSKRNSLGCPILKEVVNITLEPFYLPESNVKLVINSTNGDFVGFERESEYGRIHFTLILLSIWCTLITLTLIIFMCILCRYCRTKSVNTDSSSQRKFFNLFYPNLLHHTDRLGEDNYNQALSINSGGTGVSPPIISTNNSNNSTKSLLSNCNNNIGNDYNQLSGNSLADQNLDEPLLIGKEKAFSLFNSFFFTSPLASASANSNNHNLYNERINKTSNVPPKLIFERKSKLMSNQSEDLMNNNSVYVNHDMFKGTNLAKDNYHTIRLSNENITGINCIEIP